jgi:hypothetical protein
VVGPGRCSGTSRRDPPGLGQAERLRKFPRRFGQFPSSWEPVQPCPFYYGERSAIICIVLGPKKSSMYSCEYTPGFFGPAASHLTAHLLCLVTNSNVGQVPSGQASVGPRASDDLHSRALLRYQEIQNGLVSLSLWADPRPVSPWEWRIINKLGVN